jgi:hypothetical protein
MDPLSITASVAALLSLTGQIVSYAKLVKDAPKERATILREASSLNGLLATLESIIAEAEQTQWLRAMADLATPGGPLSQCKLALQALLKLTPSMASTKLSKGLPGSSARRKLSNCYHRWNE